MKYTVNYNCENLDSFYYRKENYDAETISLYLDGIFKDELFIFVNNDTDSYLIEELEYIILNSKNVYLKNLKAMDMNGVKPIFESELCMCNKCGSILIDRNPQIEAIKHKIFTDENKFFVNKDNESVLEMAYLKVNEKANEYYWACPKCETDSFLVDL